MLKYFWLAIYPILYPYEIHVFHVTTSIRGPIQHHVTWPKVTCLSRGKAFEGSRLRQILTIFGILGDGGGWEFHFLEDSAETYRFFTAIFFPQQCSRSSKKALEHFASASTLWWTNIAMENGPFIVDLPIKNGDFPLLC